MTARNSIDAIVPAAGTGERFRGYKQFHTIGGKPIIIYTLQLIQLIDEIDGIIVVAPPGMTDKMKKMVKQFHISKVNKVLTGGNRRIDSVRRGLKVVKGRGVIIHDAVRPATSYRLFKRLIRAMKSYKAVIPVIPIRDTVKSISRGYVVKTQSRKGLYLSQTPQGFDVKTIRKAMRKISDLDYTDEAAVLEAAGIPVKTIRGDIMNIKITEQSDLRILEKIL